MKTDKFKEREFLLTKVFTPATPINQPDLFAGRTLQIRKITDAINRQGQHAVVYGERGVGKTSFANSLAWVRGEEKVFSPRVNCDKNDDFSSVWKKIFQKVTVPKHSVGLNEQKREGRPLLETLPEKINPNDVVNVLQQLAGSVMIFDEFDRLSNNDVTVLFSDTIKALSDFDVPVTIVVVGVADDIAGLISGHNSIERCITQVFLPRMSPDELKEIITEGFPKAKMTFDKTVPVSIAQLSQGFPHYTHLLGLNSGRHALDRKSTNVSVDDVQSAIKTVVTDTEESIRNVYQTAVSSSHKESLFKQVILACALADADERGFFSAADVRKPLSEVMKREYDIPAFASHLHLFASPERGKILQRVGKPHSYRYRFANPLLKPYIYLQGLSLDLVPHDYSPFNLPTQNFDLWTPPN